MGIESIFLSGMDFVMHVGKTRTWFIHVTTLCGKWEHLSQEVLFYNILTPENTLEFKTELKWKNMQEIDLFSIPASSYSGTSYNLLKQLGALQNKSRGKTRMNRQRTEETGDMSIHIYIYILCIFYILHSRNTRSKTNKCTSAKPFQNTQVAKSI